MLRTRPGVGPKPSLVRAAAAVSLTCEKCITSGQGGTSRHVQPRITLADTAHIMAQQRAVAMPLTSLSVHATAYGE